VKGKNVSGEKTSETKGGGGGCKLEGVARSQKGGEKIGRKVPRKTTKEGIAMIEGGGGSGKKKAPSRAKEKKASPKRAHAVIRGGGDKSIMRDG